MICWLAKWADPRFASHDQLLHRLGTSFLKALFAKHGKEMPDIQAHLEVRKQHKKIDALVIINSSTAVCIEDKVGSRDERDKLLGYITALKAEGFAESQIVPIYIQTGDEDSFQEAMAAGYEVIRRDDILGLLRTDLDEGGCDSIVRDFHGYLALIHERVEAFSRLPFSEWDSFAWQGFYLEIRKQLSEGEWDYVANAAGGFYYYLWHKHSDQDSEQYLQIEQAYPGRLCFKICVKDLDKRSSLRETWKNRILDAARRVDLPVRKPKKFGTGETMTVAVLDREFRVLNGNGFLDVDATVAMMRDAANVLDLAAADHL
jgi:hypothetical protein